MPRKRTETRTVATRITWVKGISWLLLAGVFVGNCSAWRATPAQNAAEAGAALRAGDYARARQGFEEALKGQPGQLESQAGLLQTLRETGAYREACSRGDAFLNLHGDSPALLFERARAARAVGDYRGAEERLKRILSLGGSHRDATAELADLLSALGRRQEANGLWDQLIEDYRSGRVRSGPEMGAIALAAWRRGYVEDAKDFFIDATEGKTGPDLPLVTLCNFGYLFLDKYNPGTASDVFRECLAVNKAYPDALLGLALAKQYDSNSEVENYARSALEVNPNMVAARNLLAQLRIQEENYDEAGAEVGKSLEVNPRDLDALSLEAVLYEIRGDSAGFDRVEKQAFEINPSYGRLYFTLAENMVMRRKYREAVEYDRRAVALDPELYAAYSSMGMNLMRLGDLKEGRAMLQKAFDGDSYNLWACNTLDLLDQMATFATVKSEHFVFRMSSEDEKVLQPYAVEIAEEAYSRLTKRYGFTPQGPLQVEFFPDHAGFAVRTLGLPGLGALGVCFGQVVALDSPRARDEGAFNWGSTLWHEFEHVMTLQMTRHNIPRWFSEGLSVYEEQRARAGWGDDLTASFLNAYQEGRLMKVSQLNAGMMRPKTPEQIELSYFQAGLFCSMIEEKFGFDKIKESLLLFAENLPADEVFRRSLGWDSATLDQQYASYLDSRFKAAASRLNFARLAAQASSKSPPDAAQLAAYLGKNPDDFFANLQIGTILNSRKDYAEAERYLRKAESLFPEFVEPGNPYELLGPILLEQGREEEALQQFNSWSRYDETAVTPLLRAAEIYRKRKDWSNEAKALELSVYIYPYDAGVQARLGESALESGNWPAAVAACRVVLGLNPADPVEAHYNLARALLGAGRTAEAKREVLRALEIAPTYEKAQQLLLKLNERKDEISRRPSTDGESVKPPGTRPAGVAIRPGEGGVR